MIGYGRSFLMGVSLLAVLGIQATGTEYTLEQALPKTEENLVRLNPKDKAQVSESLRVKKMFGSQVWPGLGEALIPLILFNERFEFLIAHPNPPAPWAVVDGDALQGRPYFRREQEQSQAFAVPVGDLWAGSMTTLSHMSRAMEEELKENVPQEKLTPAFIKMMTPTPAQHVVYLLHEAFHAFQAARFSDRFQKANGVYASEDRYPFEDAGFIEAWNTEGFLLASALREKDESERLALIRKFLEVRSRRRSAASLAPELVDFERELEWLEGLAKYAEMRFAELCASDEGGPWFKDYRVVRNRTRVDFYSRLKRLGEQKGDLRFYLSGAAQAMILDLISPEWKQDMLHQNNICLEDLLQRAVVNMRSDHSK
ncbi:hypothetical protein ACFLR7_06910 [Acidobacteriota bacterium]